MKTGSQEYKDGTLTPGSFSTGNLNLVYYLDKAGEKYWGKMYNFNSKNETQLKGFSVEEVSELLRKLKWAPNGSASPEGAQHLGEDIRKKVHELKIKHEKSGIDEYVTLSVGISSISPGQDATPIDLIKAADQALYECKEKGRNKTIFKQI